MSLEILKDILSNTIKKTSKPIESSLMIGREFPYRLLDLENPLTNKILCFVSLSCEICVELIPELKILDEYKKNSFILITDGDNEENEEIKKYFNFEFDMLSFVDDYRKLSIPSTPYVFIIDHNNYVTDGQSIRSSTDLLYLLSIKREG